MRLELQKAVHHLHPGALQIARPAYVRLFIEASLELDQRSYRLPCLGRSGEFKQDRPVQVAFKHRDFKELVHATLKTDAMGRVILGPLADISHDVDLLLFALRRLSRPGRSAAGILAARAAADAALTALEHRLFTGLSLPPDAPTSGGAAGGGTPPARWSRWVAPLAAAVVGIAIGAGAVVLAQSRSDNVTVEAIAPLKPVADGPLGADTGTLGEAELIAEGNRQQVRVSADQLPASPNA